MHHGEVMVIQGSSVRACRQAFAGDPARIPNSHLCFSLRVFASSRGTNSPPPSPRSCSPQAASCRGQISGWKARATFNRKRRSGTLMSVFLTRRREGKRRLLPWAGRRARARARARLIFVSIRGSTSPLRFLRVFASSRETNSPRHSTATLVISNLLILAASNVPGVADALSFTLYQPLKGGRASNRAHQPIRPALQSW